MEKIINLVNQVIEGNFARGTIEIEYLEFDAGNLLFPNSVECIRQIRVRMRAFGLTDEEIYRVSTK